MTNTTLRRAAILIASLDTESADALLQEMSPDQAALIRGAVMDLGDIDVIEQQEVVGQFVENRHGRQTAESAGVEIELTTASQPVDSPPEVPAPERSHTPDKAEQSIRPFAFLDDVPAADIARALSGELPQTTAIVVAHLGAQRAGDVVSHLPTQQQTETLIRIARMATPHPEVIHDVECEMLELLANRRLADRVDVTGLARVEAILQNTNPATRNHLVADLARQDTALADQLHETAPEGTAPDEAGLHPSDPIPIAHRSTDGPSGATWDPHPNTDPFHAPQRSDPLHAQLEFSDLEQLDGAALAQVLRRADPNTTLLALAGASHLFVRRILAELPARERAHLERRIRQIGPLRLDDVQRAQTHLVRIAVQLANEGTLTLPAKPRLSVAA